MFLPWVLRQGNKYGVGSVGTCRVIVWLISTLLIVQVPDHCDGHARRALRYWGCGGDPRESGEFEGHESPPAVWQLLPDTSICLIPVSLQHCVL